MRIIVTTARVLEAPRLIDVTRAHIDSCLYHGRSGLDFAERLVAGRGRVEVPTTLNVSSLDLLHPDLYRGDPETAAAARRLMDCYEEMGCRPTWTCAPYQLADRPAFGEHVAWAESNAIVFANSVLGARTDRYGDFIDICAALTGRVPEAGLHVTEKRRGSVVFDVSGLPEALFDVDAFYPVLGHLVGDTTGSAVPVIDGLPPGVSEDRLKALGAAAASSGAVALVHVVGTTPEAETLEEALQGRRARRSEVVTTGAVAAARDELTTSSGDDLGAVCLGTPHYSLAEFAALVPLVTGRRVHPSVEMYVSTGRDVYAAVRERGWADLLEEAGVQVVVDTCTYITPIIRNRAGAVMTDSAKWAYYAPGNIGVSVVFGSRDECVESAVAGEVRRDGALWPTV